MQVFAKCTKCGHKFWQTFYTSEEASTYSPNECPQCGGDWMRCDPSESGTKPGDLSKCGRCQGSRRYDGSGYARVTDAPKEIHDSWCGPCIREVQAGRRAIIPGVSIDRNGRVITEPNGLVLTLGGRPLPTWLMLLIYLLVGIGIVLYAIWLTP